MRRISVNRSAGRDTRAGAGRSRAAAVLVLAPALLAGSAVELAAAPTAGAATAGTSVGSVAVRAAYATVAPSYDTQVLAATNAARKRHGRAPLRAATCVDGFASRWARYLATNDAFRHQSLRPILVRCHRRTAGENIAYSSGSLSAAKVVSMWMHSSGHRANILNRRFRYLGVDAYRSTRTGRTYVVQDFAG